MGVNRDAMAVRDASAGHDFKTATMAVPSGYMRTEEGSIPRDWELKRIGDIATVFSGGTPNRKTPEYWGGDVPWITTTLIAGGEIRQANEFITVTGVEESSAKWCKAGTILMAMYGQGKTRGKVAILGFDATINQACAAIELKDSSSSEYVLHVLNYMYEDIRELSNSGGQENLSGGIIKRIRLPFPTEPEQRAIAKALSDVDAFLEGLDQLIAKKRDLKQAAMQQLLTGQTRLPGFAGEWKVKRLGELGNFMKGSGVKREESQTGVLPCVRYGEIYTLHANVVRAFYSWISKEVADSSVPIKKGDLLFAGSGETKEEIGKCVALASEVDAYAGGDIVILRPRNVDPVFMGYALNQPEINLQKSRFGQGDAVVHITASVLSQVMIKLPSEREQTAIANVLTDMDAELKALEQRRAKTATLKQAMMQELLTGRTRLVESTAKECTNG